jgi:hemolysin D
MVSNRDVGFVHVGQDVQIKVDTFNFTRYGLLHGSVISLSQDAISRDKLQEKTSEATQSGATDASSEPRKAEEQHAVA